MPLLAAVGTWILGAAGAASAGAATTAVVGGIAIGATAAGVGASVYGAVNSASQATAAKKAADSPSTNAAGITNVATTVDPNSEAAVNNRVNQIGRAALIGTSPQGVQGTEPSGRYRLLGNSSGLGN